MTKLYELILAAFILPSMASAAQDCSGASHIACIEANGSGWGCDSTGDPGACCEGDCGEPSCDTWVCKLLAVVEPAEDWAHGLEAAFDDFLGSIGGGWSGSGTVGGGTGSGMGTLAVPSYVADLAWSNVVGKFRDYAISDAGRKDRRAKIIRVGRIDMPPRKVRGRAKTPHWTCGGGKDVRVIEFMRPTSDPTILSSIVVMHVTKDCTLLREDYYALGIYGWSSNRNGLRLRPEKKKMHVEGKRASPNP